MCSLQGGGARKARRTGTQQQQKRERIDEDGDVTMADAGMLTNINMCVRVRMVFGTIVQAAKTGVDRRGWGRDYG